MSKAQETEARNLYRNGWRLNGEWSCGKCGCTIGKNLLNEKPFLLARQHAEKCAKE